MEKYDFSSRHVFRAQEETIRKDTERAFAKENSHKCRSSQTTSPWTWCQPGELRSDKGEGDEPCKTSPDPAFIYWELAARNLAGVRRRESSHNNLASAKKRTLVLEETNPLLRKRSEQQYIGLPTWRSKVAAPQVVHDSTSRPAIRVTRTAVRGVWSQEYHRRGRPEKGNDALPECASGLNRQEFMEAMNPEKYRKRYPWLTSKRLPASTNMIIRCEFAVKEKRERKERERCRRILPLESPAQRKAKVKRRRYKMKLENAMRRVSRAEKRKLPVGPWDMPDGISEERVPKRRSVEIGEGRRTGSGTKAARFYPLFGQITCWVSRQRS